MIDLTGNAANTKRYAAEKRFQSYGAIALGLTTIFLLFLLVDIVGKGWPAFFEHHTSVDVMIDPASVDAATPAAGDYSALLKDAVRAQFPDITSRPDRKKLASFSFQKELPL